MKKWLMILGATLVLIVCIVNYVFSKGEFVIGSTSYIAMDAPVVEEGLPIYMGYGVHWSGFGNPTLTNVSLIKDDGTELSEDDLQLSVTSMIDEMGVTGVIDEDFAIEAGYINEYLLVENYQVIDDLLLVFRVELLDTNYENNISYLMIEYKNFGFRQQQTLEFEGFFSRD
ncbi:hypothetical protein [Halalkalibacter okhensis]|uniref:Uncharacterized protein n=1 Tax=Halalkalibacter okhensis TaxID=333138 RepID=A0A0B0IIC1_9BACI|nr:hypothetical protein [Halalkalibacter okhensis]KHF39381.1 hypothetical protein LQ50_15965 [Halalkalibacter okhensis]